MFHHTFCAGNFKQTSTNVYIKLAELSIEHISNFHLRICADLLSHAKAVCKVCSL